MLITNVHEFVVSLNLIRRALGDKPEVSEAQKLIQQIRNSCSHAQANRKNGKPIGKCPECLKKFNQHKLS